MILDIKLSAAQAKCWLCFPLMCLELLLDPLRQFLWRGWCLCSPVFTWFTCSHNLWMVHLQFPTPSVLLDGFSQDPRWLHTGSFCMSTSAPQETLRQHVARPTPRQPSLLHCYGCFQNSVLTIFRELVSKLSVPHSPHQSRREAPPSPHTSLPGRRSTGDSQHKHSNSPNPSPYPGPLIDPNWGVCASWGQFTDVAMETCIDGKTPP